MPEAGELEPHREWDHKLFVQNVIRAVNGHEIPQSQLPQTINLQGKIQEICDELIKETLEDPRKRERQRHAKVGLDKKSLVIPRETQIGEETHVAGTMSFKIEKALIGHYSTMEYLAFSMHTHGVADVPPSPRDLTLLLQEHGEVASIIITPSVRFLLLRTMQTPLIEREDAVKMLEEYTANLQSRLKTEVLQFENHMRIVGGSAAYQRDALQARVQLKMLQDFCAKQEIAMYTSIKEGKYSRVRE